jgi:hypothetical protein
MHPDKFPSEVADRLKWYVYRLVDPRNGHTFYVGKGEKDRIFQHAKAALTVSDEQEDAVTLKYQRIKAIHAAGLEVAHIIHRHGIESEDVALQIEATVMDAYPNLTNQAGGHGSGDYGVRHVVEVIAEYKLEPFIAREALILINVSKSFQEENKTIYDAVRGCWVIKPDKASKYRLVLAHRRGIVLGAFRPTEWLPSISLHFPWHTGDESRWGFVGEPGDAETTRLYVQKRVPDQYRAKGAANPVRYVEPSAGGNS